ncbi:MAG TPA: carboxypeptidase-like regulatory domain-containing protein, partial [Aequorivita sp.]|nr:carboxypeptidase-like regulatory domain-containing protein [Aequorivita sp.]
MKKSLLIKSIWTLGLLCWCAFFATAQNSRTVEGTVLEASTDEPIPGASIREKGTTNGTISGLDGEFRLQLTTANPVLVITFIGYATQELTVGNSSFFNVSLESELGDLQEVVVMGY